MTENIAWRSRLDLLLLMRDIKARFIHSFIMEIYIAPLQGY